MQIMEVFMNLSLKFKILEKFSSQANFAQVVKADESTVSRIIRGRRTLDPELQLIWAKALGCNPKDIFSNENQNSKQKRF